MALEVMMNFVNFSAAENDHVTMATTISTMWEMIKEIILQISELNVSDMISELSLHQRRTNILMKANGIGVSKVSFFLWTIMRYH